LWLANNPKTVELKWTEMKSLTCTAPACSEQQISKLSLSLWQKQNFTNREGQSKADELSEPDNGTRIAQTSQTI